MSATNAGSTANTLGNAGSIITSGANSAGMRLNSGATNSSVFNTIANTGTITTRETGAYGIQVAGVGAVSVYNTGSIITTGDNSFGVFNTGNIVSLSNSQDGSTPLTYSSVLPKNYYVIVASPTSYGKLDVSAGSVTGVMNFNISSASSLTYNNTYAIVLNGFKINNLGNSYGTFSSGGNLYQWALVHRVGASATQTDLVIQPLAQSSTPPVLTELKAALLADSYLIAPIN